jgi:LmbE family N-acetylglucosaminyl deacetylase
MAKTLTLMAVHAHPDDEASSTGGVLARYSAEGVRTIVVTCTNGEFGDAPGQVKPGQDGHDEQAVARLRLSELRESCRILGVSHLELLGYHDSGMPEWDYKDRPDAFANIPRELVAARIVALIEQYQPQVVISYDPDGSYQHPDHVHAATVGGILANQESSIWLAWAISASRFCSSTLVMSMVVVMRRSSSSIWRSTSGVISKSGTSSPASLSASMTCWKSLRRRAIW